MVIRRVNPISAAKVGGILGVLLGFVIGAMVSLVMLVAGSTLAGAEDAPGGAIFAMLFGAGAVVALPIFYGCIMFIGALVQAALYNLAAKWTGGIEVDAA